MLLMQLGEVIFGGVGCGLYGMLAFAILTVFIAGLMVGRTPEFLGKKIEPYEMKWSVLVCLATPIAGCRSERGGQSQQRRSARLFRNSIRIFFLRRQ